MRLFLFWTALVLSASAPMAIAEDASPLPLQWTHAEYSASKFFVTARVDVDLAIGSSADAGRALMPAPGKTALIPLGEEIVLSTITNKVLGQHTTLTLWSQPNLQAIQRTSLYTGRKYWYRLFRYVDDGVYSLKRRPLEGEEPRGADGWSERVEDFYPYGSEIGGHVTAEPEVLFYFIATRTLDTTSQAVELIAVDRGQSLRLALTPDGTREFDYSFAMSGPSGERRNGESIEALRLRLRVVPLSAQANVQDFKFLGLSGDIELLVDTQRRLVLEVRGTADVIGDVRLILRRVVLSANAR